MKITLDSIAAGTVPVAELRAIVEPYADVDMVDVPREDARMVTSALDVLLQPATGTPAAGFYPVLRSEMTMLPFRTVHGAELVGVCRAWVSRRVGDGSMRTFNYMSFDYDDGVRSTEWVDHGDHGLTLMLDAQGRPAFYTVMSSDGYFDAHETLDKAGLGFSIVDRLEELDDLHLQDLVGDVDPVRLKALPRLGRKLRSSQPAPKVEAEPEKPAREGLSLRQLYAPPPSPVGRARLGRR